MKQSSHRSSERIRVQDELVVVDLVHAALLQNTLHGSAQEVQLQKCKTVCVSLFANSLINRLTHQSHHKRRKGDEKEIKMNVKQTSFITDESSPLSSSSFVWEKNSHYYAHTHIHYHALLLTNWLRFEFKYSELCPQCSYLEEQQCWVLWLTFATSTCFSTRLDLAACAATSFSFFRRVFFGSGTTSFFGKSGRLKWSEWRWKHTAYAMIPLSMTLCTVWQTADITGQGANQYR